MCSLVDMFEDSSEAMYSNGCNAGENEDAELWVLLLCRSRCLGLVVMQTTNNPKVFPATMVFSPALDAPSLGTILTFSPLQSSIMEATCNAITETRNIGCLRFCDRFPTKTFRVEGTTQIVCMQ